VVVASHDRTIQRDFNQWPHLHIEHASAAGGR
jgi:hypothetical protein